MVLEFSSSLNIDFMKRLLEGDWRNDTHKVFNNQTMRIYVKPNEVYQAQEQFNPNNYNLTWKYDSMRNNLVYFNLTFTNVSYISIDSNYEDFLVCQILDRFAFYSSDVK